VIFLSVPGSSPPVRGTVLADTHFDLAGRFIPARAGNRHFVLPSVTDSSVHPRPCGEQALSAAVTIFSPGSSPPVRGTVHGVLFALDDHRFIPARARNRSTSSD